MLCAFFKGDDIAQRRYFIFTVVLDLLDDGGGHILLVAGNAVDGAEIFNQTDHLRFPSFFT